MLLPEKSIMKLYVEIAKRAKNNKDREAWLPLREFRYLNINNNDEALKLMRFLEQDENIIKVDHKNSGNCCLTIWVNQDFIALYDIDV